jgi:uncharacterized protein (DUF4213/DUF364 family)
MKSIVEEIIESIEGKTQDKTIEDARVGLCYTAVLLNDGQLGLAYTFSSHGTFHSCRNSLEAGSLKGKNAQEIIQYARSDNLLASSIGIATINALVNSKAKNAIEGNILEVVNPQKSDIVGMVGFFGPLIDPLKKTVKKLYVFEEKNKIIHPDVYPSEKITEILPQCEVIMISATTLINKTVDSLFSLAKNARETVMLGATTPFLPRIFIKRDVTILSGIQVLDKTKALQIVSEGGGMRAFKQSIKKVNFLLKNN